MTKSAPAFGLPTHITPNRPRSTVCTLGHDKTQTSYGLRCLTCDKAGYERRRANKIMPLCACGKPKTRNTQRAYVCLPCKAQYDRERNQGIQAARKIEADWRTPLGIVGDPTLAELMQHYQALARREGADLGALNAAYLAGKVWLDGRVWEEYPA